MNEQMTAAAIKPQPRLHANSIGPWGLAALAIGITSPAMGLYGLWGPMQVTAGPITPLVFIAAMVLIMPTAISYALLNSRAPSAGSACTWLWTSAGPATGYLAGLAMTTYFIMATVAQPLLFALFFRDFLGWLGISMSDMMSLILGVVVATIPVAWVGLRGAEASVRTTVQLMIVETLVVVALSITILVSKAGSPGEITLAAFDPSQATNGFEGFWAAMILGVLAFCGFDVVSTAAEETHAPKKHLPQAILLTVVGMALFWTANAWVFTLSTPHEKVVEYNAQGLTAVTPLAESYWGAGSLIVILTAFTGITAVYISCMQGASRITFAMARHGLLPRWLGQLSGEKRVPRNAVLALLVATVALDVVTLAIIRNGLQSFLWWANGLVFFATLTFLAVNVANTLFFLKLPGHRFSWVNNLLVPVAGAILNGYLIYQAFLVSLWSGDVRTGKSVVIGCLVLFVTQLCAVIFIRRARSDLLAQAAPIGVETGE